MNIHQIKMTELNHWKRQGFLFIAIVAIIATPLAWMTWEYDKVESKWNFHSLVIVSFVYVLLIAILCYKHYNMNFYAITLIFVHLIYFLIAVIFHNKPAVFVSLIIFGVISLILALSLFVWDEKSRARLFDTKSPKKSPKSPKK